MFEHNVAMAGVRLGEHRAAVLQRLGEPARSREQKSLPSWFDAEKHHAVVHGPFIADFWGDSSELKVESRRVDSEWVVSFVEVSEPAQVGIRGVGLNGLRIEEAESLLSARGLLLVRSASDSSVAFVERLGVGLFVPDGFVRATSIG